MMLKEKVVQLVLFKSSQMEYYFKELTVRELIELIELDNIDLNPDYQRNYIWSPNDQKYLIDTIIKGFPLPSFFVYLDNNGKYEMVDGQQRSKTIFRFVKGKINSSKQTGNKSISDLPSSDILNYKLPFIIIQNIVSRDSLREFYVLINKKGIHLNVSEVNKSEHFHKLFMKLANEVLDYQNFIDLNLFTDNSIKRMNDRSYIEELLGYLLLGIKEKKKVVEQIYKDDITEEEYDELKEKFESIIDKIAILNKIHPISSTRYKQKNDFFTLFTFINENSTDDQEILNYQYQILLLLDGKDNEGKQFIRPTNEFCSALRDYANNCVSQSNSSHARDRRLDFFNAILKNTSSDPNEQLLDVLNYLSEIYGDDRIDLTKIGKFQLLNLELLK